MNTTHPLLQERDLSGFPLSVGTGLAMESLFAPVNPPIDPSRAPPKKLDPKTYDIVLLNASTILRNLLSTLASAKIPTIPKEAIYDTLLSEIEYLQGLFQLHEVPCTLYVHTYDYPKKHYEDKLRSLTTDHQKLLQSISLYCLLRLKDQDEVLHFSHHIKLIDHPKALILTHVPWDLLSHTHFVKLDLLESHTGAMKSRKDWNSKYFKLADKDMSFLPFTESLLTVFGDTVMFKPQPLKVRTELYERLKSKSAHPLMSDATVKLLTT